MAAIGFYSIKIYEQHKEQLNLYLFAIKGMQTVLARVQLIKIFCCNLIRFRRLVSKLSNRIIPVFHFKTTTRSFSD